MAELITVPSFVYEQYGEGALQVNYYNGTIEIKQYDDSILIKDDSFEKLFREIRKHKNEAKEILDRKK